MRLDSYIEVHGVSLRQLAKRARVAHSTISRLLRGKVVPATASVTAIANATDGQVSPAEVLASYGSACAPSLVSVAA